LKEAVWEVAKPITCDIPPNPSRGYLIKPPALLEHIRTARAKEIAEHEAYEFYNSEQDKISNTIY
jgi:hypothetical protein